MKMKQFGLTETKLFHFHWIFKIGDGKGVQASPLWIRHFEMVYTLGAPDCSESSLSHIVGHSQETDLKQTGLCQQCSLMSVSKPKPLTLYTSSAELPVVKSPHAFSSTDFIDDSLS